MLIAHSVITSLGRNACKSHRMEWHRLITVDYFWGWISNILSHAWGSIVTLHKGIWGLDWLLDLLDTPIAILNYNFRVYRALAVSLSLSAVHYTRTWSSWPAVPYQLSSTGFQRRTFSSWVPELSPCHSHSNSCMTHSALTHSLHLELPPLVTVASCNRLLCNLMSCVSCTSFFRS
jgi:hypothetical protein